MSAFGTGVRQREYIALELLLNLKIILLDGRLLERRINDCGDGRGTIRRVGRTGQHRTDETGEGGRGG